jgi:hypothetical protein
MKGMKMAHEHNIAVMEADLKHLENAVNKMIPIVEGLVITTNNLLQICKNHKERQDEIERTRKEEVMPKLNKMWDKWNEVKGGSKLTSGLIGFAVGVAALGTFVLALMEHYSK